MTTQTLASGRIYDLFVPDQDPTPLPAVVVKHGGGSNRLAIMRAMQILALAQQERFLVIAPQGLPAGANPDQCGWCSGDGWVVQGGSVEQDTAYLAECLDDVKRLCPRLDEDRIYDWGFSEGSERTAADHCLLSNRFAAYVCFSGGLVLGLPDGPPAPPQFPRPHLQWHGSKDGHWLFGGGAGPNAAQKMLPHPPIMTCVNFFAEANGCALTASRTNHTWGYQLDFYRSQSTLPRVSLRFVDGLGHQISGGEANGLPDEPLTTVPVAVSQSWDFCRTFSRNS